ncbi:MAG: carboxypeptidase-like regulatory domain-containing protein, partial [Deinococcales bacterium]|nr:carboxypeptidase-like regulatory domain-containing protein [Chitinophagaceae bacterium]
MKKIIIILIVLPFLTKAQNTLKVNFKNEKTKEVLVGVSVVLKNVQSGTTTDTSGFAELKNIPNGKQTIVFSLIGFTTIEKNIVFPETTKLEIFLEPS